MQPLHIIASLIGALVVAGGMTLWQVSRPLTPQAALDDFAARYLILGTALGQHFPAEVDIYFGPTALDSRADRNTPSLTELAERTRQLLADLDATAAAAATAALQSRHTGLREKTADLLTRLELEQLPQRPGFAEELARVYGITLTPPPDTQDSLQALEALLPGRGTLAFRIAAFRNRLVIPADKRRAVFEAALAECRRRTALHWPLPPGENLVLEWSREVPAAWHDYEGASRSILRVNDLSIAFIDSAVAVACHEAYPGHHTQYTLIGQRIAETDGNIEDTLTLLRSKSAVVLEGAANVGVQLAFPAAERLAFERDVLAPLAGIVLPDTDQYLAFQQLTGEFTTAVIPIIQEYYDGLIPFNTATFQLERDALVTSPSALLEFVDEFGTYSIGYNYAGQRIQEHLAANAQSELATWQMLRDIITTPDAAAKFLFAEKLAMELIAP